MNDRGFYMKWVLLGAAGIAMIAWACYGGLENSYLFGLGCGCVGSVAGRAVRAFYWNLPSHQEEYQRRMREEQINLGDERKTMIRHLSGYRMNQIMFWLNCLLILLFGWLQASPIIMFIMTAVLVFQYLCGVLLFRHYSKIM